MVTLNPLRWGEGRQAKKIWKVAELVNDLQAETEKLSDGELKARTPVFQQRVADGESLDDMLPEVFATVREAAWRVLGQRPYDVQVFGGVALHRGNIAEMKTGEGKTLTSTMPIYLNALTGKGVHLVTVNEYLARRDAEWMGQIHTWLGLEVGAVYSQQPRPDKKKAYEADITYGTTNEFGFDYLRDNMALTLDLQVQRGHHFALLDEVDSILIDEARTPLIISGQGEQSAQWYQVFARRVAPNLTRGEDLGEGNQTGDYVVDEAKRNVGVTEEGVARVEKLLGIDNLYESVNTPLIHHLQNAIKAKELFKRDREYIVQDGEVKIVDEQTGRVLEGRRYSEGLHQSIEAKEGVKVKDENQTLATVTLQNYYRQYDKLAGMTGTAKTEEVEFLEIYELGVVEVPTNRPVVRDDKGDQIYKTEDAKFDAVVKDILGRHEQGQPVLVGTTSVEKSEVLSSKLRKQGVAHEVLNAKNHAREANIVAQAGRKGAVTVATNMAGRGTDILLGGNPEELAKEVIERLEPDMDPDARERAVAEAHASFDAETKQERAAVLEAGGLYVIGTERHESRRIDNQLRGRSGRQGDPGESRFFLSLQDDLMRLFNADAVDRIMSRLNIPDDVPIEAGLVNKAVANAQRQVESRNFDVRKNVLKYDDVLNEQRKVVYGQRQHLVEGDEEYVDELAQRYLDDAVEGAFDQFAPDGVFPEEWDLDGLWRRLGNLFPMTPELRDIDLETVEREELIEDVIADAQRAYEEREEEVGGDEVMREIERRVILQVVDRKWRQHLYEMDALRDGIGLRAVGQRDPLVEYQTEAYHSFVDMMASVKDEAVTYFFHLPVQRADEGAGDADAAASSTPDGGGDPAVAELKEKAERDAAVRDAAIRDATASGPTAPPTQDVVDEAAEKDTGNVRIDAPTQPTNLSYQSGSDGGSASYTIGGGGDAGRMAGDVEQREDGTTVRRIATGGTYTKDDAQFADVGRNDPCPCDSGKKFKKCHGVA